MSWRKEHREHPWTTKKQAKQIAADHRHKPEHKRKPQKGNAIIQTARTDATKLVNWGKGVGKKP